MAGKQIYNYNQLYEKAQLKKQEEAILNGKLNQYTNLDNVISVKPSTEIALLEHYNAMPEVEVDPSIKIFWQSQQEKIDTITRNMEAPKSKYLNAYNMMRDYEDGLQETTRNNFSGVNNINTQIKDAKNNIKEARKRVQALQYEVDPFAALLGVAIGDKSEANKVKEAYKGLDSAKKQLKALKERKREIQESQDKSSVKIRMCRQQMVEALEEIAVEREKAEAIDKGADGSKGSVDIHKQLEEQYKIVDMYKSVQTLKNSNNYQDIINNLNSSATPQDHQLATDLNNLPNSLPNGMLKISIENPLRLDALPVNSDRLAEIEARVTEINNNLQSHAEFSDYFPDGINTNNISDTIEKYQTAANNKEDALKTKQKDEMIQLKNNHNTAKQNLINAHTQEEQDKQNEHTQKEQDKQQEIDKFKLDESKLNSKDTIENYINTLEADKNSPNLSNEDKDDIDTKIEHLNNLKELAEIQEKIDEVKNEILNSSAEDIVKNQLKEKYDSLQIKLQFCQQKLDSDKYSVKLTNLQEEFTNMQASHAQELSDMKQQHSQELDNLQEQQSQELLNLKKQHTKDLTDLQELHSKSISDLQELQQLINEREQLNVPLNLRELKNVVQGLDQSQIAITGGSISAIFTAIKNAIEAKRNTNTKEIEDRTQKSKNEKMDPDLVPQDGR